MKVLTTVAVKLLDRAIYAAREGARVYHLTRADVAHHLEARK